jgi:hypothetical protein
MADTSFSRLRDFVEPAHPAVIRLQDDLINIYTLIRDRYQRQIDEAFGNVARQTGFVVTTTLPVVLTVNEKRVQLEMGTENLRGTLFESAVMEVLKPLGADLAGKLAPGEYPLYLIWHDALKLKLRTDWIEPAHWRRFEPGPDIQVKPGWGVREPAHWFDPRLRVDLHDALVINAIDQVYPELRLLDRVEAARSVGVSAGAARGAISAEAAPEAAMSTEAVRRMPPGVHEPAHFRQFLQGLDPATLDQFIAVLQDYQRGR